MQVGYDIDGVLADFKTGMIREAQYYGIQNGFPTSPNEWNMYEPTGFRGVWDNVHACAMFWLRLPVLPDAWAHQPFMWQHCKVYITARPQLVVPNLATVSSHWLNNNDFPDAPVVVNADKAPLCAEFGLDYFIEDSFENWIEINKDGSIPTVCFLVNTPHNLNQQAPQFDHLRFDSLQAIEREIKKQEAING